MTSRSTRWLGLCLVPLASALLYGCPGESDDGETTPHGPEGYNDVLYEGETTDEALLALASALEQGAPQPSMSQAPVLSAPEAGPLPAEAPTFQWSLGATARLHAPGGERRPAGPELLRPGAAARRGGGWAAPLAALFGPVRAAHAHGDPFSGNATLVVFASSSDPKLVRVFTGATEYTPSADAWAKIRGAGGEVTLTLVGAVFEQNRIGDSGGPYQGSVTTFTVSP